MNDIITDFEIFWRRVKFFLFEPHDWARGYEVRKGELHNLKVTM